MNSGQDNILASMEPYLAAVPLKTSVARLRAAHLPISACYFSIPVEEPLTAKHGPTRARAGSTMASPASGCPALARPQEAAFVASHELGHRVHAPLRDDPLRHRDRLGGFGGGGVLEPPHSTDPAARRMHGPGVSYSESCLIVNDVSRNQGRILHPTRQGRSMAPSASALGRAGGPACLHGWRGKRAATKQAVNLIR